MSEVPLYRMLRTPGFKKVLDNDGDRPRKRHKRAFFAENQAKLPDGWTPLLEAASHGHEETASVNTRPRGVKDSPGSV